MNSLPILQSFPPVADADALVLILGSMPGARSLEDQQYYAHPRNAFWRLMSELFQAPPVLDYTARLQRLQAHRIALWDVLKSCQRSGSLDTAIITESIRTNDFAGLFRRCPGIERIVFNGQKAEALFRRRVLPELQGALDEVELIRLPSTSPAHAAMSFEQKKDAWEKALAPCLSGV